MISGESSAQPPPPPDSHLVTAELEGSTLTRAQYNTICSLTSSLLLIPTGDLVYDGHTLNPLTLHWHCPPINYDTPIFLSLLTEMAQEGIKIIHISMKYDVIISHLNVSNFTLHFIFTLMSIICRRLVFTMLLMMEIFTLWILLWKQECQWIIL